MNYSEDNSSLHSMLAVKEQDMGEESQYMEACQHGDLETVKSLIESGKATSKTTSPDGVTGLHWACINNKLNTVRYLASQGAEIDARGGELNATPLQWAARFGLVYIVDFLVRECQADPSLTDGQGYNSLHLAVHSSNVLLVAYMMAYADVAIDSLDPSRRTSLHWAAYQGDSLSVEVLLKSHANVNKVDDQGFTPLHWSLMKGTVPVMSQLLKHGGLPGLKTNDGKDCFMIADDMNCRDRFQEALKENNLSPSGKFKEHFFTETQAKIATFLTPYVTLPLVLSTLSSDMHLAAKGAAIVIIMALQQVLLAMVLIPMYMHLSNPILKTPFLAGVFSSTAFWIIACWLFEILPQTFERNFFANFAFLILTTVVVASFFKAMLMNSGCIPHNTKKEDIQRDIGELLKENKYDSRHFCIHTMIRKPLRAKYSAAQDACIAKFDHFCPWLYNDVGVRNHKLFVTFSFSLQWTISVFLWLVWSFYNSPEKADNCLIFAGSLCGALNKSGFLFGLTFWTCLQYVWLSVLNFVQAFQISKGLTTYEASVIHKKHIHSDPHSVYSSVPSDVVDTSASMSEPSRTRERGFLSFLLGSQFTRSLGIDQFILTSRDVARGTSSRLETDYGVKQNWLDFWFIKTKDDSGYNLRTLLRLPIQGEGNLNGLLVDFYHLWKLPQQV